MASIEDRALTLLGSGIHAEAVANALGVTPSRISQLLAQEEFAAKVTSLRYEALQQHNARDSKYDSIEDKLLHKLENCLPLMVKPAEIIKALQLVNGAKRRGSAAPEQIVNQQNIVQITVPTQIKQKFVTNVHNQVVSAGTQDLLTMPSGTLFKNVQKAAPPEIGNEDGNSEHSTQEQEQVYNSEQGCSEESTVELTITPVSGDSVDNNSSEEGEVS